MLKIKHILVLAAAVAGVLGARAQYDQSISVEGRYVPEFIAQDRIGVFPKAVRFPMTPSSLQYASEGVDADFPPQAIPVPATGWRDTRDWTTPRGYLNLGLGSWLDATLDAGYRFVDTDKTRAGICLHHRSNTLWKPRLNSDLSNLYMRRYDERLGLYLRHNIGAMGYLGADLSYHFGHFNYYGYNPYWDIPVQTPPFQTLNDVKARVRWVSPSPVDRLSWNLEAGVRYFGFWRQYFVDDMSGSFEWLKGGRETDVDLQGGVRYRTSRRSAVGMDLEGHVVKTADDVLPTYGTLALTPYYRYAYNRLHMRFGARIYLAFNVYKYKYGYIMSSTTSEDDDRFPVFSLAPDVAIDYDAGAVAMFLHVGGGNQLNTLAHSYAEDLYCAPFAITSQPTYTPVDSKLGFRFGPFAGFSAALTCGYRATLGQLMHGWYMASLNGTAHQPYELKLLHGVSFGIDLAYDAGRYFKVEASGSYQPQKEYWGYYNGFDMPRWLVGAEVSSNPWSTLRLSLGCDYRGERRVCGEELPDWFTLGFKADYQPLKWLGVWVKVDNLTNRRNYYSLSLPVPGITATAGLTMTF